MKKLFELFKEIVINRCDETCDSVAQEEWYVNTQNRLIEKRANICAHLNNNLKTELDDYDDLKLELSNKVIEKIYIQAFKDGMSVRELLTPILTPNSSL